MFTITTNFFVPTGFYSDELKRQLSFYSRHLGGYETVGAAFSEDYLQKCPFAV